MTFGKGCGATFHPMVGYKHIFIRNRLLHFVLVFFLAVAGYSKYCLGPSQT